MVPRSEAGSTSAAALAGNGTAIAISRKQERKKPFRGKAHVDFMSQLASMIRVRQIGGRKRQDRTESQHRKVVLKGNIACARTWISRRRLGGQNHLVGRAREVVECSRRSPRVHA